MSGLDPKVFQVSLSITRAYPQFVFERTSAAALARQLLGLARLSLPGSSLPSPEGAEPLIEFAAHTWTSLATTYGDLATPFVHIQALMCFLETLSFGRRLLYRGQENGNWSLETSLARSLRKGLSTRTIESAKQQFLRETEALPDRRHLGLAGGEPEALCQHYGFPTDYLDFSWSLETAAFFALGGDETYRRPADSQYATGAIWVLDAQAVTEDVGVELVSLPAQVMRPWLQRGEFLNLGGVKKTAKIVKFLFSHQSDLWVETLWDLGPYSVTPMSMFLMPRRDPLEETAAPIRERLHKEKI